MLAAVPRTGGARFPRRPHLCGPDGHSQIATPPMKATACPRPMRCWFVSHAGEFGTHPACRASLTSLPSPSAVQWVASCTSRHAASSVTSPGASCRPSAGWGGGGVVRSTGPPPLALGLAGACLLGVEGGGTDPRPPARHQASMSGLVGVTQS